MRKTKLVRGTFYINNEDMKTSNITSISELSDPTPTVKYMVNYDKLGADWALPIVEKLSCGPALLDSRTEPTEGISMFNKDTGEEMPSSFEMETGGKLGMDMMNPRGVIVNSETTMTTSDAAVAEVQEDQSNCLDEIGQAAYQQYAELVPTAMVLSAKSTGSSTIGASTVGGSTMSPSKGLTVG